jgi:hypothetical protein
MLSNDVDVELLPVVTTAEATMVDFFVDTSPSWQDTPNLTRVKSTVQDLLRELDATSSKTKFFRQYPGEYEEQ